MNSMEVFADAVGTNSMLIVSARGKDDDFVVGVMLVPDFRVTALAMGHGDTLAEAMDNCFDEWANTTHDQFREIAWPDMARIAAERLVSVLSSGAAVPGMAGLLAAMGGKDGPSVPDSLPDFSQMTDYDRESYFNGDDEDDPE